MLAMQRFGYLAGAPTPSKSLCPNTSAQQKAVGERGDRRNNREKEELREILRVTTRGIQFACVKVIVRRLNELAIHFRENKPSIDNLRLQLAIMRRPVRL